MIKEIVDVKEPSLRTHSKQITKIDKKIRLLIKDLKDTLDAQSDPEGVGLAAPQIGKNFRVFVMKPGKKIITVINPKIIWIKDKKPKKQSEKKKEKEPEIMEGCLSLPYYYGPIKKPNRIKIKFKDEKGEKIEKVYKDFEAQIVQHEIDHLNGILFVDRLLEQKKPLYKVENDEWEKVDIY
jgi:peptide deformylase